MSRIGKKPVSVPAGVQVSVDNSVVTVEGPKGKLSYTHRPEVQVAYDDASREVSVTAGTDRPASGPERVSDHAAVVVDYAWAP